MLYTRSVADKSMLIGGDWPGEQRRGREPDAALAGAVLEQARLRGLIVIRCGLYRNVVRLLAPLVSSDEDAHEAIEILSEALDAALTESPTAP